MTEHAKAGVCRCGSGDFLFGGPGGDLLSHALRRSTIGAEGFHGRVRDGIGCFTPRHGHQVVETGCLGFGSGLDERVRLSSAGFG